MADKPSSSGILRLVQIFKGAHPVKPFLTVQGSASASGAFKVMREVVGLAAAIGCSTMYLVCLTMVPSKLVSKSVLRMPD